MAVTDFPRWTDYVAVDDLVPDDRNPKDHDDPTLDESLERFGYTAAIEVDERTGKMVAGHGRRLLVLRARDAGGDVPDGIVVDDEGRWRVPVQRGWASKDDDEALAYMIASNRLVESGGWNNELLARGLLDLESTEAGLAGLGYSSAEVDALIKGLADDEPGKDLDDVPDDVPARTKPGDLWRLGPHRLLCADSTDPASLTTLMDGLLANAVWTDPPYGVGVVGGTARHLTIENDVAEGLRPFLAAAFAAALPACQDGAHFYVASPAGPLGIEFGLALADAGWQLHQTLVWVKDQFVLGHSDYHYGHEDVLAGRLPCRRHPEHERLLYGYLPGSGRRGRGNRQRWFGSDAESTVFVVDRPRRSEDHPTMKPVALIEPMVRHSTPRGGIVLDPFLGSGSTLLAAARNQRVCYGVELDPGYCDVVCRRWQDFSGVLPVRAGEAVDFAAAEE